MSANTIAILSKSFLCDSDQLRRPNFIGLYNPRFLPKRGRLRDKVLGRVDVAQVGMKTRSAALCLPGTRKGRSVALLPPTDIANFFGLKEAMRKKKTLDWETARRRWKRWSERHSDLAKEIPKQTKDEVVGKFM